MQCVKTGAHVWVEELGEWVYGDAFLMEGTDEVLVLHLCYRGHEPARPVKHFTVNRVDHWFDEHKTSMDHQSVLVAKRRCFVDHGYDGVPR